MKLSFKKFMEELGVVDQTPTTSYHGQAQDTDMDAMVANFPSLDTYKQWKVQEDPTRARWTDMQWMIQYHFDRSHAEARAKKTKKPGTTPRM